MASLQCVCGCAFGNAMMSNNVFHTYEKLHQNGKHFTRSGRLQQHLCMHTREKPYRCDKCGDRFTWPSHLRKHICCTRTKEKPYRCDKCRRWFISEGRLQRHSHTHSDTREKPYQCLVCMWRCLRRCPNSVKHFPHSSH